MINCHFQVCSATSCDWNRYAVQMSGYSYNEKLLYIQRNYEVPVFFLLFENKNREASVNLPYWNTFLLLYCYHKRNICAWLE